LQEDYHGFSCQLAGNPPDQWFSLIRKAGRRGRRQAPEEFLRRMNRLREATGKSVGEVVADRGFATAYNRI
jgi:hypothetical protein